MRPEEEVEAWRETHEVLESISDVGAVLSLDPLTLALSDAYLRQGRSRGGQGAGQAELGLT
jgi:hypothetical protein